MVEHVRNVLGFRDAEHEESSPQSQRLAITALSCSLVGQEHRVRLVEGSIARSLYGRDTTVEDYYCNYGVNPEYVDELARSGLHVSGVDDEGDVRLVERRDHPFFVGTLFLPQTRCSVEQPHPVMQAFVQAARNA